MKPLQQKNKKIKNHSPNQSYGATVINEHFVCYFHVPKKFLIKIQESSCKNAFKTFLEMMFKMCTCTEMFRENILQRFIFGKTT